MTMKERTAEYDARDTRRRMANTDARQSYERKYLDAALKPKPMRAPGDSLWVGTMRFFAGIAIVLAVMGWWMFH